LYDWGVPLTPDERAVMQAQLVWLTAYDGYQRLAGEPQRLAALLADARAERKRSGRVPDWCGVDLLKGWAFYLYRDDYFTSGGHSLSHSDTELFREWNDVMDLLTQHPGATDLDRPPVRPTPARTFSTEPRAHREASFLAAKQARLWEPHVAPINRLVQEIVTEGQGDVPYVDPDSGGVTARVLLLLEAPARAAAHGSGMLSADNDDATAAHVWEAYRSSGLPREWGVHWNAVPWYVGKKEKIRAVTPAEVVAGRRWLTALLDLAPDLRVVLTMGVPARKAVAPLLGDLDQRGLTVMSTWHPSPRNYNSRPHSQPEVLAAFDEVHRIAQRL
jgi:uracil-DNA glycosylase